MVEKVKAQGMDEVKSVEKIYKHYYSEHYIVDDKICFIGSTGLIYFSGRNKMEEKYFKESGFWKEDSGVEFAKRLLLD